jgi:DNA-directed RNA polymerase subunit RPC12/RpoP
MEITIKVQCSIVESVKLEDLDTIRCPECGSVKFWLSEYEEGYCADCDKIFIAES